MLSMNEFINLEKGDVIQYKMNDTWNKTVCSSNAFYNSDADEPGWEVETEDGVLSAYNDIEKIEEVTYSNNPKDDFFEYIKTNFTIDLDGLKIIKNIIDWIWVQSMDKTDTVNCLTLLLDGTDIEKEEIEKFINWD